MLGKKVLKEKYLLILGYSGTITIGLGIALILNLITAFFFPTPRKEIEASLLIGVVSIVIGALMRLPMKKVENKSLSVQEGGIIVVFTWIIATILGGAPFVYTGQLNFTQASFEAVSGFTTTGLSVVDVTKTSYLYLMWRSVMQFIGGAGLAVVMLAAVIGPLGDGLYNAEGRSDRLVPHARKSARMIMIIYSSYIIGGTILYVFAGMPIFDSLNHSIAAVSTGGFSTKAASIGFYDSVSIELITVILMILGTINFASHGLLWKGKVKEFFQVGETKFTFFLLGIAIPITFYFTSIKLFETISKAWRVAIFEITSAVSTSGFSTVPYSNWNSTGIFILIITMLIGGGIGSTAGGIKIYRVYTLVKSMWWNIRDFNKPKNIVKANYVVRPEGKFYVDAKHISDITVYTTLYFTLYIISVIILTSYGYEIKDAMFELASCLSTVGLSYGITSPSAHPVVLWTMTTMMFLGRLEFLVVFYTGIKIFKDIKLAMKK